MTHVALGAAWVQLNGIAGDDCQGVCPLKLRLSPRKDGVGSSVLASTTECFYQASLLLVANPPTLQVVYSVCFTLATRNPTTEGLHCNISVLSIDLSKCYCMRQQFVCSTSM